MKEGNYLKKEGVLFVHNSVPEYRIEFWRQLSKFIKFDLLITNKGLEQKIYNLEYSSKDLNVTYWDNEGYKNLCKRLEQYNVLILPPVDTLKEFLIAFILLKICKRRNIAKIYWVEKWEPSKKKQPVVKKIKNAIHKIMIRYISKQCTICIASGSKSSEYIRSVGISPNRIKIAYDSSTSPQTENEIDIRKKYGIEASKRIILYLGRVISRKGCRVLIKAVHPILKEVNAVLLVCGDGEDLCYCKKLAGSNQDIIFAGTIQPAERKNYYMQSNVFVLPSICEKGVIEAWGLSTNEALECGTPVIVSDVVGAAWDLVNEDTGVVVNENDVSELREAIAKVLNNENLSKRERIIKAYEKYTVCEMAKTFADAVSQSILYVK